MYFINLPLSKLISDLKIASKPGSPESLQQLIEIVKSPVANMDALSVNSLGKEDKTRQSRDKKVMVES